MTIKHDPILLSRPELIDALRGYVKPSLFQDICYQPTATLRGALLALQCPREEREAPERPAQPEKRTIEEIDMALEEMPPFAVLGLMAALAGVMMMQDKHRPDPSARLSRWLGRAA